MKKIELTYAEIEKLQFALKFYESKEERDITELSDLCMKLISMRAQLEYLKMRGE